MAQTHRTQSDLYRPTRFYEDPIEALSELPQPVDHGALNELTGKEYNIDQLAEQLEEENLLEKRKEDEESIEYAVIRNGLEEENWSDAAYEALDEF